MSCFQRELLPQHGLRIVVLASNTENPVGLHIPEVSSGEGWLRKEV
jgi:hypothetical protein